MVYIPELEKNLADDTDLLCHRAEMFRSKLISDFHLLDTISETGGQQEPPKFYTNDLMALILINCVVLGVQGELNDVAEPWAEKVRLLLEIFDYCAMMIYVIEIVLKWMDNFWVFWKNRWNIFDFLITFLFFVPEIINFSTGEWGKQSGQSQVTIIANNLRSFRILRSLKMVSRFQKVRLIVLAVTKAFQAMVFITVLLFIFAYIFAIIGVIFFKDSYENSPHFDTLVYNDSFKNIGNALITLFQLFTLDHWHDVYVDLTTIFQEATFPAVYVITWIAIGSFIFRNIFVGIMVNNFQSIRNDLFLEVEEIQDRERRDMEMQEFADELDRQNNVRKQSATMLADIESDENLQDDFGMARNVHRESVGLHRPRTRRGSVATSFDSENIVSASDRRYSAQEDTRKMSVGSRRGSLPVRRRRYSIGGEVDGRRRSSVNQGMLDDLAQIRQTMSSTAEEEPASPPANSTAALSPTQEEEESPASSPPDGQKEHMPPSTTTRRDTLSVAPPSFRKRDSISPVGKRHKRDSVSYKRTFSLSNDGKIELDKSGSDQTKPKQLQDSKKKDGLHSGGPVNQVTSINEDSEDAAAENAAPEMEQKGSEKPTGKKWDRRMTQMMDSAPQNRTEDAKRRFSLQAWRRHRDSVTVPQTKDRKTSLPAQVLLDASVMREEKKEALKAEFSFHAMNCEMESSDWQERVERNFLNLAKEEAYYCWPRDTLFRYLLILEGLMENLHERQEIIKMINEVIIQIHDS